MNALGRIYGRWVSVESEKSAQLAKLRARGRRRGVLTYHQVNDLLPAQIVDPEEIEGIVDELEDGGVSVVDATLLATVQRALRHWDPIGVIADPEAMERDSDEYDTYALRLFKRIEAGATAHEIASYLAGLRVDAMQLGERQSTDHEEHLGRRLAAWRDSGCMWEATLWPFR